MSLTLLNFNARSIMRQFDQIEDELALMHVDIIFISETWLSSNLASLYCLNGYNAFHRCRGDRTDGGASIYIRNKLSAILLLGDITINNAFNVCVASIGQEKLNTLLLAVYKAPRASVNDVEAMCDVIDKLTYRFNIVIIAGDFNFPSMR